MNRRLFLNLLSLSGASMLLPRLARAASLEQPDSYFVMIRMAGGWDVTLGLDPKIHGADDDQDDMFIEYKPQEILKAGNLSFGPAMKSLIPFGSSLSVVNGLITATTDNGHAANLEYMSSGNGSGKAPYIPAEIAASSKAGSLGLIFSGQTNVLDRNLTTTSTSNLEALKNSLALGDFSNLIAQGGLKDSYFQAEQAMLGDSKRLSDLNQKMKDSGYETETDPTKRAAKILSAAFASQTAYQGQIDISAGGNFDSHAGHEVTHLAAQTTGWNSVAAIFDIFKATQIGSTGTSLYDQTTFMVISEFSRTPALNGAKGKDHNPLTNSVLLAGGGIVGGVTFGSSHLITRKKTTSGMSSHTALPVNIVTGVAAKSRAEVDAGGFQYLTPETLVATVARTQNVDWVKFRSVGQSTPFISSLLKP